MALEFSDEGSSKEKKNRMSRPFGVALLVAGVDPFDGPSLWNTEPSGTYTKYLAAAVGSAQEGATNLLQEQFNKDMSFNDAEILALTTLRQVMEEKLTKINIEVSIVKVEKDPKDVKFRMYSTDELESIIGRLPAPTLPTLTGSS